MAQAGRIRIERQGLSALGILIVCSSLANLLVPIAVGQSNNLQGLDKDNSTLIGEDRKVSRPISLKEDGSSSEITGVAMNDNGVLGYVADPTFLRRSILNRMTGTAVSDHNNILSPIWFQSQAEAHHVCETTPGNGIEREAGWKLLLRVVLNGKDPEPEKKFTSPRTQSNNALSSIIPTMVQGEDPMKMPNAPRILCVVYTHEGNHDRLRAQTETWGWRCDGFLAASTKTEKSLGSINLMHIGPETYENMWQKTRSILLYVYKHFMNDHVDRFDYVYLVGDDVSVIVENLRNYLSSLGKDHKAGVPLYIGSHSWAGEGGYVFNGGGSGYLLNSAALKLYMESAFDTCWPTRRVNAEDRMLGRCMKDLNVSPVDTADKAHRQRFQIVDPNFVATKNPKKGFWKRLYKLWEKRHGYHWGVDLVSTQTCVFHLLKKPVDLKRIYAILYRACPRESILGKELSRLDAITAEAPAQGKKSITS